MNVDDKSRVRAIHLFAGAGGGILGGCLDGWRTVCAVEINEYCRDILVARQNDGSLDPFPIWDDVCTFDGNAWRGYCDIICGGFPCQNISPLGDKTGIRGEKSGLWTEFARIIGEVRPAYAFIENSSSLTKLGLDVVLRDIDALGYDAEWECLSAAELGAPHIRNRIWILAKLRESGSENCAEDTGGVGEGCSRYTGGAGCTPTSGIRVLADPYQIRCEEHGKSGISATEEIHPAERPGEAVRCRGIRYLGWKSEPGVRRVVDGVANIMDRLQALGNGQVPCVAREAFHDLYRRVNGWNSD